LYEDEVYYSVRTSIIVEHAQQLWKVMHQVARDERRPEKINLLLSAFALVQHDPATKQVIQKL